MIDERELGNDYEFLDTLYKPRGRLSGDESIEALGEIVCRWGRECFFCKKSAERLEIEDKAVRESKGMPPRLRPVLVVHELVRGLFHTWVTSKNGTTMFVKWGGCRPTCFSCNEKLGSVEPKLIDKKTMTWQAKQSVKRNTFKKICDNAITKKIHICKNMYVNRFSEDDKLDCSQEMLNEAIKQRVGNKWDIIDISEYGIKCSYCDDERYSGDSKHLIKKGKPPTIKQTDQEKLIEENPDDL